MIKIFIKIFFIFICFSFLCYCEFSTQEHWIFNNNNDNFFDNINPGSDDYLYYKILDEQNNNRDSFKLIEEYKRNYSYNKGNELLYRQIILDIYNNKTSSISKLKDIIKPNFNNQNPFNRFYSNDKVYSNSINNTFNINDNLENLYILSPKGLNYLLLSLNWNPKTTKEIEYILNHLDSFNYLSSSPIDLFIDIQNNHKSKININIEQFLKKLTISQMKELANNYYNIFDNNNIQIFIKSFIHKLEPSSLYFNNEDDINIFYSESLSLCKDLLFKYSSKDIYNIYRNILLSYMKWIIESKSFNISLLLDEWKYYLQYTNDNDYKIIPNQRNIYSLSKYIEIYSKHLETSITKDILLYIYINMNNMIYSYLQYYPESYQISILNEFTLHYGCDSDIETLLLANPSLLEQYQEKKLDIIHSNIENKPYSFTLAMQDISSVRVRIYHINPLNFYLQNPNLQLDINNIRLEGLTPHYEYYYEYSFINSLQIHHRDFIFPDIILDGCYVIEWTSNDLISKILFQTSSLLYTSSIQGYGHSFYIFDNEYNIIKNASIFIDSFEFSSNDNSGEIIIPFLSSNTQTKNIILSSNYFAKQIQFKHFHESYDLLVDVFIQDEQLRKGEFAKILVTPFLSIQNTNIPFQLVDEFTILVEWKQNGIVQSYEMITVEISEFLETYEYSILVPNNNIDELSLICTAVISQVTKDNSFSITSIKNIPLPNPNDLSIQSWYISQSLPDYLELSFLGKSGEPIPNYSTSITIYNDLLKQPSTYHGTTDTNGIIQIHPYIGTIKNIRTLSVENRVFNFPLQFKKKVLFFNEGDDITIPWQHKHILYNGISKANLYSISNKIQSADTIIEGIFSNTDIRNDYSNHISLFDEYFYISPLLKGNYLLTLSINGQYYEEYEFIIIPGYSNRDYLLSSYGYYINSNMTISKDYIDIKNINDDKLQLELSGNPQEYSIYIIGKSLLEPSYDYNTFISQFDNNYSIIPHFHLYNNHHISSTSGVKLNEEYSYILQRSKDIKYPGHAFDKPSLLTIPIIIGDSHSNAENTPPVYYNSNDNKEMYRGGIFDSNIYSNSNYNPSSKDFLKYTSIIRKINNPNNTFEISLNDFKKQGKNIIDIYYKIGNDNNWKSRSLILEKYNENIKYFKNIALKNSLNSSKHIIESKNTICFYKNNNINMNILLNAYNIEIYSSIFDIYQQWKLKSLLSSKEKYILDFLIYWNSKNINEKIQFYKEYSSHEINYFLKNHDFTFFLKYIQPVLLSKLNPDIVDLVLLNSNIDKLKPFLQPYIYEKLNIFEQMILLPYFSKSKIKDILSNLEITIENKDSTFFDFETNQEYLETDNENIVHTSILGGIPSSIRDESILESGSLDNIKYKRNLSKRFYTATEQPKEYGEQRYLFQIDNLELKPTLFWLEYGQYLINREENNIFLPKSISSITSNSINDFILSTSIIELPLESSLTPNEIREYLFTQENTNNKITLPYDIIIEYKASNILDTDNNNINNDILVHQSIFKYNDENNKNDINDLRTNTIYKSKIYYTNLQDNSNNIYHIISQIPSGAIPLGTKQYIQSKDIELPQYQTKIETLYFYFPYTGIFNVYPSHVFDKNSNILGKALNINNLIIKDESIPYDNLETREDILHFGSNDNVIEYINNNKININIDDINNILWRLNDKDFYYKFISILGNRGLFNQDVWNYSLVYEDWERIYELILSYNNFQKIIFNIDNTYSSLFNIDNIYKHLEYDPFILPRIHKSSLHLNSKVNTQYELFLNHLLLQKSNILNKDYLEGCYYMILQNRINDAKELYSRIKWNNEIMNNIHYQYMKAYMLYYELLDNNNNYQISIFNNILDIISKFNNYPISIWHKRFYELEKQLSLINNIYLYNKTIINNNDNSLQSNSQLDSSLDIEIINKNNSKNIKVNYYNFDTEYEYFDISIYTMDIEILFSTEPFNIEKLIQNTIIQPNYKYSKLIDINTNKMIIPIPQQYQEKDIIIEVKTKGLQKSVPLFSNSISVITQEKQGILQVYSDSTLKPLHTSYIKIYSKLYDGSELFYKDGYTDLLGLFNYAELSSSEILQKTEKFSIFISTKEGNKIIYVNPPKI